MVATPHLTSQTDMSIFQQAMKHATETFQCSPAEINNGRCFDRAMLVACATSTGCKIVKHKNHFMILHRGRFHDAECPHGVKHWRYLPKFAASQRADNLDASIRC
jgi:hypothetical protein